MIAGMLPNGYDLAQRKLIQRSDQHQAAANASKLGADPTKGFLVGGTSAGGNLAAVVSHLARDEKLSPPITGVALLIPALADYTLKEFPEEYKHEIESYKQNADAPILGLASIEMFMGTVFPLPSQVHTMLIQFCRCVQTRQQVPSIQHLCRTL